MDHISLKRRRFDDIECPQPRPLLGGQREFIDDGNTLTERHQRANCRAKAGLDRNLVGQGVAGEYAGHDAAQGSFGSMPISGYLTISSAVTRVCCASGCPSGTT